MEFILQTLLRGGSPNVATRNKDFASLYRKVISMKSRIDDKRSGAKQKQSPSSVGHVVSANDTEQRQAS